ncbi:OmpA family protein [Candidatus Methylobacter oryzae]|nr:OmpA family protein [Candidatus Methylobacter oryzae]
MKSKHIDKDNIMLEKILLTLVSLAGIALLPMAQAGDRFHDDLSSYDNRRFDDDRWYVAPFGTFIKSGGDRHAKDGWGGGMGIGKMLDRHFNVEMKGFYQEFGGDNGPWSFAGGTVDLQYYFIRDRFSPYAVIGGGAMNSCASANCGIGAIGEAGAGFTYEVHDNFLLRSDVRYRYNNNFNAHVQPGKDEFHDMVVNVGFVIPFGDKPRPPARTEPPVAAAAPAPSRVDRDSDGDGVLDSVDQCPGTMRGARVDNTGCPVRLVLKGQHFQKNSAALTLNAKIILDDTAKSLIADPQKNDIEVQGHTSSEGSSAYNMKLSQRRAQSVVDYLQSKGVTNKLMARGYGESQPIADNRTAQGRAANRRVELIWIE